MTTWIDCPTCLGSGKVEKPTIVEKLTRHLIYAAAHAEQTLGLMLAPDETHELAVELGILPAEAPPGSAPAEPSSLELPASYVHPSEAIAAVQARHAAPELEPEHDAAAADAIEPYFAPEPDPDKVWRPEAQEAATDGENVAAPVHPPTVSIVPHEQPWTPAQAPGLSTPGDPAPATPTAPGAASASLTGPPGG